MNKSKLICVICRGFNKFFDAPKADGRTPVTFRTAIVIKKNEIFMTNGMCTMRCSGVLFSG